MKTKRRKAARLLGMFCIGAGGYPLLELLWRGRTHPSMALAGGLSACWLDHLAHRKRLRPWQRVLLGGLGITGIEAGVGLMANRRHRIWDYRKMPLQWQGQVCLPYSAAWCLLSWLFFRAVRSHRH